MTWIPFMIPTSNVAFGHSVHKHNSHVVKILAIAKFDLFCDN